MCKQQKRKKRRDASEVAACIGSVGMCWKSTEVDGADGTDRDGGEYKVSKEVKRSELVRTR
jgi:hypothetical protein